MGKLCIVPYPDLGMAETFRFLGVDNSTLIKQKRYVPWDWDVAPGSARNHF